MFCKNLFTNVLAQLCSDHSIISFALDVIKEDQKGKKFLKNKLMAKQIVRNMNNYKATTTNF